MSHTHDTADHDTRHDPNTKDPAKAVDLPPYGPRNPDPITDAAGAHPIETGIGAAIGGAASGLAVGALTAGPVGAVIGAIAGGAVVGGLAGKGVGELIDPTEDYWLRELFQGKSEPTEAELAAQRRAFRFGLAAQARFPGKMFRDVETELRRGWEEGEDVPWAKVYESVQAGFDRTQYLPVAQPADGRDIRPRS